MTALAVCHNAKSQSVVSPLDKLESFFYDGDSYPPESFFFMPEYDADKKIVGFGLEDIMKIRFERNADGKLASKTISYIDPASNFEDSYKFVYNEANGSVILFNCNYPGKEAIYRGLRHKDAEGDRISLVLDSNNGYYSGFVDADVTDKNSRDAQGRVIKTFRKTVTDGKTEYSINEYGYDEKGRLTTMDTYITDSLWADKLRLSYSSRTSYTKNGIRIEHKFEQPSEMSDTYWDETDHEADEEVYYVIEEGGYTVHTVVMEVKTDKHGRITEQNITFDGKQMLLNLYSYDKKGRTSGTQIYNMGAELLDMVPYLRLLFSPVSINVNVSYDRNVRTTKYRIINDNYWGESDYLINITTQYDKNNRPERVSVMSESADLSELYITDKQYSKDGLEVTSTTKANSPYYEADMEYTSYYTYDTAGRVVSTKKHDFRTEYEYNHDGQLYSKSYYSTDYNDEIVPYSKNEINAYTEYEMVGEESSYSWDSELGKWELDSKTSYTYHPLTLELLTSESLYWNESEQDFYYGRKEVYVFDESGSVKNEEVSYSMYSGDEWVPDSRTVYVNAPDSEYDYTNYILYRWSTDSSEWIPESKYMDGDYFEWSQTKNAWKKYSHSISTSYYDDPYINKSSDSKKQKSINYKLK